MNAAVVIKDLEVVRSGQPVLTDFTVRLPSHQVVGLIGPSGSGKTTLMRATSGVTTKRCNEYNGQS